jgi:hypothetical protein
VILGAFQVGFSTAERQKAPAAELSYLPTFHHDPWFDQLDPVEAGGRNGFNIRFRTIERDLGQVSTVVDQMATALRTTRRPGPGGVGPPAQLTFTPNLLPVRTGSVFTFQPNGVPVGASEGLAAIGVANLALPERRRLTTVRFRGSIDSSGGSTTNRAILSLLRGDLSNQASFETLAAVAAVETGPFDITATVPDGQALVDLHLFRYVLRVNHQAEASGSSALAVELVEINFAPPS